MDSKKTTFILADYNILPGSDYFDHKMGSKIIISVLVDHMVAR